MTDLTRVALLHDPYWCIEETAGRQMWMALRAFPQAAHLIAVQQTAQQQPEARSGGGDSGDKPWQMVGNTAILTLTGPMTKHTTSMSSGTSTVRLRRMMRLAVSDPDVKSILLVVDSPGGSVSGTSDIADTVAHAAAKKPLIAFAEDWCASAAMWTACQATKLYVNRTAMVGSIGTVMVIDDCSRWAANIGLEVLVFSTGAFKGAGVEGTEITKEQRDYFQSIVDGMNAHFLQAVATGRKMDIAKVKTIADGRMYHAAAAQSMGLIDGISTIDDVLDMLARAENGEPIGDSPNAVPDEDDGEESDPADGRASGSDKNRASGEDKKPMKLKEAWKAFQATLAAAGNPVEADGPEALETQDAPAATGAENRAASAQLATLQAQVATQAAELAALKTQNADDKKAAQLATDLARVDAAVKSFRLVPAVAETFRTLAKESPEGFAIAMAGIEANEPIAALKGGVNAADVVAASAAAGGGELKKLEALTDAHMKENPGMQRHEAFKAVCAANKELAEAYYASVSEGGQG